MRRADLAPVPLPAILDDHVLSHGACPLLRGPARRFDTATRAYAEFPRRDWSGRDSSPGAGRGRGARRMLRACTVQAMHQTGLDDPRGALRLLRHTGPLAGP